MAETYENGQWVTIKGRHVFIRDGEDVKQALSRSIAEQNEQIKDQQIAKAKAQADAAKSQADDTSKYVVNGGLKEQVQKIQDAYKDKSLSKEDKAKIMHEFKTYMNENIQVYEESCPAGSHLLNVTGNRVWYKNKSGTYFILAPNGEWLKFNNDLSVTRDGKIDSETKSRVKALADQLHSKK